VSYQEVSNPYTFLLEISSALVFLHGPLLYFYMIALISPGFRLNGQLFLHVLPCCLYLLLVFPSLLQGKLAPFPEPVRDFLAFTKLGSILVYAILILVMRKKHLQQAENTLSTLDSVQLKWIQYVIYGVLLVWITGLLSQLMVQSGGLQTIHEDILVNISVSILVIVLGYYGIRQTPVFISFSAPAEKISYVAPTEKAAYAATEDSTLAIKYQRSGLNSGKSQLYADSIAAYMQHHKPYTDPELSLTSLAEQLSLSPNHLSQILNEQFGKNFWDFVNEYRVKQVIGDLHEGMHKKHTLLAIALDAGFNSKASFNRAFKKFTGETPSGYLKKM
jgi:AraC-like DNA-binding protein/TRAP-type C4-dicarboxylate transport system permease small subunit